MHLTRINSRAYSQTPAPQMVSSPSQNIVRQCPFFSLRFAVGADGNEENIIGSGSYLWVNSS